MNTILSMITTLPLIAVCSSLNTGELRAYYTNNISNNICNYDIPSISPRKFNNKTDDEYHVLFDPSTGQRSHFFYNHMSQIIQNSLQQSNSNHRLSAYTEFAYCLEVNRDQLKVKDLKDIYRIRGIPKSCCSSLAIALLPIELMDMFQEDEGSNCRINSFFVPNGAFDPHTHPLFFASVIVAGAYTHSYLEKEVIATDTCSSCNLMFDEVCAEHNKIYRKNDNLPLEYHGTVKLYKIFKESFTTGDVIMFDENAAIHIIDEYQRDTVTVNWVTTIGDEEIDVFTSHETPFRTVLTKNDTRNGMKGPLASAIIDKSIGFFK